MKPGPNLSKQRAAPKKQSIQPKTVPEIENVAPNPVPAPNKRKKRKQSDPIWKRQRIHKKHHVGNIKNTSTLVALMGCLESPPTKGAIAASKQVEYDPSVSEDTLFHTPTRLIFSSPHLPISKAVSTPKGTRYDQSLTIEFEHGHLVTYLPKEKAMHSRLDIPKPNTAWLKTSPVPKANMTGMIDVEITEAMILETEKAIRKRSVRGEPARIQSQDHIMKIPATKALKESGFGTRPRLGNWVHFKPHCICGDESQVADNLGLGTVYANAEMELMNGVIRDLVMGTDAFAGKTIYLSFMPKYVEGFEAIRLLDTLTYEIKDAPNGLHKYFARMTFDMLSTTNLCKPNIEVIQDAILKNFNLPIVTLKF